MLGWFDFITIIWPIASAITPLLLGAGILWLRTKFPSKEDFAGLSARVDAMASKQAEYSTKVDNLAADLDDPPTRVELMAQMAALSGRLSGVEEKATGLRHQLDTANDYLQVLVERGLQK